MKIFLAAGHGGRDPGAVTKWAKEADETLRIVGDVKVMLKNADLGEYELWVLAGGMTLAEKVEYINQNTDNPHVDFCLEVHLNAHSNPLANGTETLIGHKLTAQKVHKCIMAELGLRDRGLKDGTHLYFNRKTRGLSAIAELGFLTNRGDYDVVRINGAKAVARAVCGLAGAPWPIRKKRGKKQGTLSKAHRAVLLAAINGLEAVIKILLKLLGE